MVLNYHPQIGTIVICDFYGLVQPEMDKRRPVVIVSPRFRRRYRLCTVVPLSITSPTPIMPYHYQLKLNEPLPDPYDNPISWVKGDMLTTVSFDRLSFPYIGKDSNGKRKYIIRIVSDIDLLKIRECVLHSLALSRLTKHL